MKKIVFLLLQISSTLCFCQNEYTYSQPEVLNDGWKTSDLRLQDIDTTKIYRVFSHFKNEKNKMHSVLLIKDGEIIIEEYLNGNSRDKPHDLRSTSKSIRSILLGIAIDKGFIESIDDPISKYLKSHTPKKNIDPRKK